MRYGISKITLGFSGFIEIDEAEYQRVKDAKTNYAKLLQLEETLDLVTENYLEFEDELLTIASRQMVFMNSDDKTMSNERVVVTRRIVNLLSTCRMYLDQIIHQINQVFGNDSDIAKEVKEAKASIYDRSFGYRVMEALRNYTQHRGFPIQSMLFSGEWLDIDNDDSSRLLFTIVPRIRIAELASDGEFKKTVLEEMLASQTNDVIDIRLLIRDYIEGIGSIHEKLRELTRLEVQKWEGGFNNIIKRFQVEFSTDESLAGLAIVAKSDDYHVIEHTTIVNALIERRKGLEAKNRAFNNLHKRYASNEIRKKNA